VEPSLRKPGLFIKSPKIIWLAVIVPSLFDVPITIILSATFKSSLLSNNRLVLEAKKVPSGLSLFSFTEFELGTTLLVFPQPTINKKEKDNIPKIAKYLNIKIFY
jgi:hypothetical protein